MVDTRGWKWVILKRKTKLGFYLKKYVKIREREYTKLAENLFGVFLMKEVVEQQKLFK